MEILLLHANAETREMVAFSLEGTCGAHVLSVANAHEAFDLLVEDGPIDLIVCEDSPANLKLFKFLLSVNSEIPCILIQSNGSEKSSTNEFPDMRVIGRVNAHELIDQLAKAIQNAIASGIFKERPSDVEYVRIKTELLIKVIPLQADIYIQLSRLKFVRLFQRGDIFESKDLEKFLLDKKVQYLYLKKPDCPEFIRKFKATLAQILQKEPATAPDQMPLFAVSVHEAVMELGLRLGFTAEVQAIVKENIRTVIQGVRHNDNLRSLLVKITQSEANYICGHSVVVAHVASSIAIGMGWNSDTTLEKLVFAAFLHDITLKNPLLALVDTPEELQKYKHRFTEDEHKQFVTHAQTAAEMMKRFSEIPPDVDTIILQHHERPDGTGVPRHLSGNHISSLSAVFIVAHDLVQAHYKRDRTSEQVIASYQNQTNSGVFRKIIQSLPANLISSPPTSTTP